MNLGVTSVAAPNAASSRTPRYSSTARPADPGGRPAVPSTRVRSLASAWIRLASTAKPSPPTQSLFVLAETRPDSRCWLFDPCGTYHPFSSSHQFLLCERERVKKGLHRGLAEAPAALVRPLLVVVDEPGIEIGLQFLDRAIDLFTERHPIELVETRAMNALADPVGMWALGLGAAVIDVLDRQVELVLVAFPAAELGAAIGQHPAQPDAVLIVELRISAAVI